MEQLNTVIRTKGVLFTPFGSFSGSTEYLPSLCMITFFTSATSTLNNSLLTYVKKSRLSLLEKYCDSPMACKTEVSEMGLVTFYMFQAEKVVLAQSPLGLSSLNIIGTVKTKCICFLN
jgi:hypothetical protein